MPVVNVPFTDEEHRDLRALSASWGVSQREIVHRSYLFAMFASVNRLLHVDGKAVDLAEGLEIVFRSKAEAHQVMRVSDEVGGRLRTLESFVLRCLDGPDTPSLLKAEARRLAAEIPFKVGPMEME